MTREPNDSLRTENKHIRHKRNRSCSNTLAFLTCSQHHLEYTNKQTCKRTVFSVTCCRRLRNHAGYIGMSWQGGFTMFHHQSDDQSWEDEWHLRVLGPWREWLPETRVCTTQYTVVTAAVQRCTSRGCPGMTLIMLFRDHSSWTKCCSRGVVENTNITMFVSKHPQRFDEARNADDDDSDVF